MKEDIDKERLEAETNKLKWKQRSVSALYTKLTSSFSFLNRF